MSIMVDIDFLDVQCWHLTAEVAPPSPRRLPMTNESHESNALSDAVTKVASFEVAARGLNGVRAAQKVVCATEQELVAAHNGILAAQKGAERIQDVAQHWKNTSQEQIAGRIAEEFHAASYNIDAAAKGLDAKAATGSSSGLPTAAEDIIITRGRQIVDSAQVKYHATPAKTTLQISRTKYDGLQRVVPSDQHERVREIAAKRGIDGLGQRNFPDVAKNASDRIRSCGAESTPLSRTEALNIAKAPEQGANKLNSLARSREMQAQQKLRVTKGLVKGRLTGAVKSGAAAGAAVGGGISAVSNIIEYANGTKSSKDAVVDTITDTAACAATGAAVSGAAIVAEAALLRVGAGALAGGAAPVAVGLTAVEVVKDFGRLVNGDIDGEKFAKKTGSNLVKGGATWGGMEGGAVIGTAICPGIGTVVGGVVGGLVGALFGSWITS